MIPNKLLVLTLLVLALGGLTLTAYAVGPSLGSGVAGISANGDSAGEIAPNPNSGPLVVVGPTATPTTTPLTPTVTTSTLLGPTENLTGSLKIATAIAVSFTVDVNDVVALHDSGWGYGEIFKLYSLAQASGKTVEEIMAMREAGEGWGQIAHDLGLPPGNHGNNLGSIVSQSKGNGNGNGNGPGTEEGQSGNGPGQNGQPRGNNGNQGQGRGQGGGRP